jgi:hypothetical protein
MNTPSEDFTERYKQIERVADARGRLIGIGRLRVSQKLRITGMTTDLEGSYEVKAPDGTLVEIPRRAQPMLAAMVREIDGVHYPFPKSRAELDGLMDHLDDDGFAALLEANSKLNVKPDGDEAEAEIDRAKK